MSTFVSIFNQVYVYIISHLPKSPFQGFIGAIDNIPYLKYLNWFFPVSECIAVMQAFLSVIVIYYLYQAVMRYVHLIG